MKRKPKKIAKPKPCGQVPILRELHKKDVAERKRQFLEAFMDCGRVDLATKKVGVLYHFPYAWAKDDEAFAAAWAEARQVAAQRLEDAAFRRSVTGTLKPIYQKGQLVGMVREFSDTLTMFLLRGLKPETYRERVSTELTGKGGGPIESKNTHGLTDESAELFRQQILGVGAKK